MTESFQNISITLPKDRMKQHVFYSTVKSRNDERRHSFIHETSKTAFKEMSYTTQFVRQKDNLEFDTKLEEQLNEKNHLLIKQSKWKNYYLKQEISVLLEEIIQQLDSILENNPSNRQLRAYRKKLEKIISKVQMKKKSQANWIEFFGFSPNNQLPKRQNSEVLNTQHQEQKNSQQRNQCDPLSQELSTLREQNKGLIQSLNILTLEIQSKQKQITQLQDKYSKAKTKKQSLKIQLTELHQQYETLLAKNTENKEKLLQQNNPIPTNFNHKSHHFHTYSLDRDFRIQNSNILVPSEKLLYLHQDSQKLFTLSDTPFITINKQVPLSLQYFQVRKKLPSSQKSVSEKEGSRCFKNKNIIPDKIKNPQNKRGSIRKKYSCFSDVNQRVINQNSYEPTQNVICEQNLGSQGCLQYLILSQALAIEKLLERV